MRNLNQYRNRFFTLMESTIGNVKPLVSEQKIGDFTYSVAETKNGKFRIYVTGGKYTTPTDAETAFGKGTYWADYDTIESAQEKINSMNPSENEFGDVEDKPMYDI